MKKTLTYALYVLFFAMLLASPSASQSQNNNETKKDIIFMLNYETKSGKVVSINDKTVKFIYSGETLEYELAKSSIAKIEFASGRVEVLNTAAAPQQVVISSAGSTSTVQSRKNKMAVLPFEIVSNDANIRNESFARQIQQSCIDAIKGQSPYQTVQDPMVTNSILAKHHFTADSMLAYTPQEWAELLDVEYVVVGSYIIQNKGSVSSSSGYGSYNSKKDEPKNKTKGTVYGSSSTYTSTSYDTKLNMRIYNDSGETLYSENHSPAFGQLNSYKAGLKWMIKRSPFKKK